MSGLVLSATRQISYSHPPANQPLVKNSNTKNIPNIPPEIIRIILGLLKGDKKTITACALVNRTFNLHVTPILYHTVSFSFPYTFTLFAKATIGESQRYRMIRHLDLSGFSTMGLQKSDATIQKVVTPETLISILRSCIMLETFSVSETLESTINFEVLQVLAFESKNIKTLDFCGFSSKQFGSALASLAEVMGRARLVQYYEEEDDEEELTHSFQNVNNVALSVLKRLSLHECSIISEYSTILTLLAHAPNITHLDLGGCSISDMTINFLATKTNLTKILTHLLLARCKNISSEAIASLVIQCENLRVLNLYGIATAISEYDLITILSSPSVKNLQTLDVGLSHMTTSTLYAIQENCTSSLQFLGIAKAQIPFSTQLDSFLKSMPSIKYIDFTGVLCLTPIIIRDLLDNLQKNHSLHTVEMSESLLKNLYTINGWRINDNFSRRYCYTKLSHGKGRVHSRKLDVAESGSERMSKIFKYYSFDV
ncbi:13592_t:CDS:1 [Funneliformis geosporum]|uniref:1551_t:CDS:1 n=1 Tax=Funneliformis geosporum TaxID=1117311 RepID=A0A9W4SW45_9GLOM|nr:13592_t:CDS:1 [Funneliformis geosporum]CAI2181246.1 1551_t:CDS:1 [Funneliformis geosporum]